VNDPRHFDAYDEYGIYDEDHGQIPEFRKANRERRHRQRTKAKLARKSRQERVFSRSERVESRDGTFRCKECKTIVGIPISGGKHRNHCPLCLFSRHVDRSMPGDRSSDCRSMMHPIGLFTRRGGEQVLMHECRGCGLVRHNRVAADDNVVAIMRLPVVGDQLGGKADAAIVDRTA
jgi:hypothetical protein